MLKKFLYLFLLSSLYLILTSCSNTSPCPPDCISENLMNKNWEKRNLQNVKFTKADLSRANLSGANLSNADLRGANLRGSTLDFAILKDANLVGANLSEARLVAVNFENADLSGVSLAGANLIGANLTNAKIDGCNLTDANLSSANLVGVRISGSQLNRAKLNGADLSHAVLSGNDLSESDLSGSALSEADLSGSNLSRAILIGSRMNKASLIGAILQNSVLDGAELRLADFQGASLIGASIKGASMDRANLANANLTGTNLQGSVLTEANLSMAKFAGITLESNVPKFSTAKLGGASLNRADLSYAYLAGVSFRGVSLLWSNLSNAILKDSIQIGNESYTVQSDWIGAIREGESYSSSTTGQSSIISAATPSPFVETTQTPSKDKSTLTIGILDEVYTLNPLSPLTVMAANVLSQIYDTLFELQPDGTYHSLIVNDMFVSEDGLTYTCKITDQASFQDGTPFTAEDIAFSLNLYKTFWNLQYLKSTEAPDKTTIIIKLAEPVQDIRYKLGQLYILPKHIWKDLAADNQKILDFKNEQPIGSGPFILTEFVPGKQLRFEANTKHWMRKPKVNQMIWRIYKQQDEIVEALIKGEIDAVIDLPVPAAQRMSVYPSIRVISGPPVKPNLKDIIFNVIDPQNCPPNSICNGHPALRDVNVRLALAYATDKKRIIETTMSNMATPGLTLVPQQLSPWFNTNLQDYPFDLEKAKKILDDNGYLDINKDGIREMPNGKNPLRFRVIYPEGYPKYEFERLFEILNDNWSKLGIELLPSKISEGEMHATLNPSFNYDIAIWGWGGIQPDPSGLLSVLTTTAIETGRSETGYSNPIYDKLHEQQRKELDFNKRKEMIWELQKIILQDLPYIIPYYKYDIYAIRTDRFTGWDVNQPKIMPLYPGTLANIEPLY